MPSKFYTLKQKEDLKITLMKTALQLYSEHGIKHVRLNNILKAVDISKPFFYTFYDSVQSFVIQVIDYQWMIFDDLLNDVEQRFSDDWKGAALFLMDTFVHYRQHGYLVMTHEEEIWVKGRLSEECYQSFMIKQISFFERILQMLNIKNGVIDPRVFGNLILSIILILNSGTEAFPFLYLDVLEDTANCQIQGLLVYLEGLRSC